MSDWLSQLPETFSHSGEVIYQARNQIRVIDTPWGAMNVKQYHCPAFINRIIYNFFRKPKAVRAYDNANELLRRGIPTPEPIAYIIENQCGLIAKSYLITRQSPLTRRFYEFREHGVDGYEAIIEAFAHFTANIHQQGIYHRDYSPGNILFDIVNGQPRFELVDINRMSFYDKPIPPRMAFRNFARLWGDEAFFICLANTYAKHRGWDQKRCQQKIIYYWKQFWKHRK